MQKKSFKLLDCIEELLNLLENNYITALPVLSHIAFFCALVWTVAVTSHVIVFYRFYLNVI